MKKILLFLLVLLFSSSLFSQITHGIKGITTTGIKGISKNLNGVIAYQKSHPIPLHYKVHLQPEVDGPEPIGQDPNSKSVAKSGTLVDGSSPASPSSNISSPAASNFLAIWGSYASVSGRESPYTPPDNCGDVGPDQIIATANCRMKVFAKPSLNSPATTATGSSTEILTAGVDVDLNVFFSNSSLGITGISDPHVRYDRFSGRWFVVAIDVDHRTNNYACIAVSKSSHITTNSDFDIYYFNVSGTGGSSRDFFDYPTLGIDKFSLYIGGNMFARQTTYSGSTMWVVDKASLLAGSMKVTSFPNSVTHTDMYTPQGVHNDDPNATEGYFIGASQTYYSKLVIRRVSYLGSTPTLSSDLNLSTQTMYTPNTVPTLGGTAIDGNDRRLCAAMIKKNKISGQANLWVAQGTLLDRSGIGGSAGDRDGALWLEIGSLTSTPTILQSATLFDGVNSSSSSAENYIYPTIAMNGQGNSLMGFTSAGPSKYTQAAAAQRFRTDAFASFHASTDFTNTTSSYNPGANRWGDFTQTVVDPTDDMTMWTFTEYVPTTNAWGVRAAQFLAPAPPTPVLNAVPACGATTSIDITATSTNNSEFFDPGSDNGGPGFNRLTVAVSGGTGSVSVSNVTFVNPTKVTADFTVSSNASGTFTVTVTNPDGQKSSTNFSLNCSVTPCAAPTGLSASNITSNSAILGWTGTSGANYDVDYSLAGANSWTNVATATTSTSVTASSLNPSSSYDWRVRTHCSGGGTSTYSTSQFTTSAATTTCNAPTNPSVSSVTSGSATLAWTAASGANSYDVQYKATNGGSWTTVNSTSTSVTISGLTASTSYDWQVRTNCSSGSSTYLSGPQFTTTAASCDVYEPNNSLSTAAQIGTGSISAQINTVTDVDYYAFSTSGSQKNLQVTLTNLPANYDLTLYDNNGKQLMSSTNTNNADETVFYNSKKPGTYYVKVAGHSGTEFSSTVCYSLTVNISSGTYTLTIATSTLNKNLFNPGLKVYPVPASNTVTVSFDAVTTTGASITFINELGQQVMMKKLQAHPGTNINTLDVSALQQGIYTVKVNSGTDIQTSKLIISK